MFSLVSRCRNEKYAVEAIVFVLGQARSPRSQARGVADFRGAPQHASDSQPSKLPEAHGEANPSETEA